MTEAKYQEPAFSKFRYLMVGREGDPYYADDGLEAAANAALALGRRRVTCAQSRRPNRSLTRSSR
jgi:hypothetical protein